MGLLIFTYRKHDLIRRKHDMEYRITQLSEKLNNLTSYASSIADGVVSLNELMTVPPSLFNRMSMFMMYSHAGAMAGAQEKYDYMSRIPGAMPQIQDPKAQEQYSMLMFKNLYDQERERFKKVEEKMLDEQEKKITQEKEKLQTLLKEIEAELESVKGAEDKAAKDSAPKFA